ncbi:MAG: Trk system potassium transporter TrkA [Clostridiaceae bacterium]|jgi:trk system potassium uptake protein TrkA|nr:Trk system potassium transporter TrkA [Clostridiaceae bacterium]
MQIVIGGAGKIGQALCLELADEGHDIILIEKDENTIERIIERSDISGIAGSVVDYDIQIEAGVPDCDLFISVTGNDEINLISAILADRLGAGYTVARVGDPQYGTHMGLMRRALGVSLMINPKLEAAREIAKSISSPSSVSVESFVHGRVNMHEMIIDECSGLCKLNLSDFRKRFTSLIVCAVQRGQEVVIPGGSFIFEAGDVVLLTGFIRDLEQFCIKNGIAQKPIKDILVIGGGEITDYLCRILERSTRKYKLTVIEQDEDIAWALAAEHSDITVLHGDGTDHDVLQEINYDLYDAIVALTGIDEENIMIGLLAAQKSIRKIISKVNRTEILPIVQDNGLQTIITPKSIVTEHLVRFVRAHQNAMGSNVEALHRIFNNAAEVLEFCVRPDSKIIDTPLKELNLKDNILIVFILRINQVIFPTGDDVIKADDHIVVVSKEKMFDDVDDILSDQKNKPKFLDDIADVEVEPLRADKDPADEY